MRRPTPARRISGYAHNGSANIGTQITTYLAAHPVVDGRQLFVIWGGTNDFGPHSTADPAASMANLSAEITELARAGAKQFLVPNLMPLGEVPAVNKTAVRAKDDTLSSQFNVLLADAEGRLEASLGIKIHRLDVYSLVDTVIADPGRFGITNDTGPARGRGIGKAPEGAVYVRLPPLGAWSWSGPGFSQAPTEASPLMTNSRLIQCHARVLPNPDQNGKARRIARSSSGHTAGPCLTDVE